MLFNITYQEVEFYVEAVSMEAAIATWRESFANFDGDETPDAVVYISDTPVIRQILEHETGN